MLGAEQSDKLLLDVVGVRDVGGPLLRVERLERRVRLVLGEQHFGSVPSCGLFHCSLPFFKTIARELALSKGCLCKTAGGGD